MSLLLLRNPRKDRSPEKGDKKDEEDEEGGRRRAPVTTEDGDPDKTILYCSERLSVARTSSPSIHRAVQDILTMLSEMDEEGGSPAPDVAGSRRAPVNTEDRGREKEGDPDQDECSKSDPAADPEEETIFTDFEALL